VLQGADRLLTLGAIVATATIVTSMVMARKPLDRGQRLLAVVLLGTTWCTWFAARLHIHEAQFDAMVRRQKSDLELRCMTLSGDIADFSRERGEAAPPPPKPATWEHDVATLLRYDNETSDMFESRFGAQVRKAHDLLALEGIRDRDFEAFYRHPANAFQINVVASKLVALAHRLQKLGDSSLQPPVTVSTARRRVPEPTASASTARRSPSRPNGCTSSRRS
jgi:hypothetical protein